MRVLLLFIALFAAACVAAAVFTYPVWLLLQEWQDVPFHRVANRIGQLTLAVGVWLLSRALRIHDRTSFGLAQPPREFVRSLVPAVPLGIAMMAVPAAILLLLGLRLPGPDIGTADVVLAVLEGLGTGLVVAALEETFLRGAMYGAMRREAGIALAVVSTALLYAAVHFVARYRIPVEEIDWTSGVRQVAGSLRMFAQPSTIVDAFVCLTAVGILLSLLREVTGSIAQCIGLHAGWVTVIVATRELTVVAPTDVAERLLSSYDGFTGWLLLGWAALVAPPVYMYYARRARAVPELVATPPPHAG